MGNLEHRIRTFAAFEVLHQIVVGNTGSDDTHLFVGTVDVLVEWRVAGFFLKSVLFAKQRAVMNTGVGGQKDELFGVLLDVQWVLRALGLAFYACTGM